MHLGVGEGGNKSTLVLKKRKGKKEKEKSEQLGHRGWTGTLVSGTGAT